MQLTLIRRPSANGATIGQLYINGKPECFICEDEVRGPAAVKVFGKTAIPAGTYPVIVNRSERFSRLKGSEVQLPLLIGVPGFEGVRIHPGNTAADTEGCLLPGLTIGPDKASVQSSRIAFGLLFTKIQVALAQHEAVKITIK
jgi:hypothetical protein